MQRLKNRKMWLTHRDVRQPSQVSITPKNQPPKEWWTFRYLLPTLIKWNLFCTSIKNRKHFIPLWVSSFCRWCFKSWLGFCWFFEWVLFADFQIQITVHDAISASLQVARSKAPCEHGQRVLSDVDFPRNAYQYNGRCSDHNRNIGKCEMKKINNLSVSLSRLMQIKGFENLISTQRFKRSQPFSLLS